MEKQIYINSNPVGKFNSTLWWRHLGIAEFLQLSWSSEKKSAHCLIYKTH